MLNAPSGDATDEASSAHGTVIAPVRRNFPLFPARNRAIRPGTGAAAALHIHSGRSGTATDAVAGLRTWSLASMQRTRWHHSRDEKWEIAERKWIVKRSTSSE